MICSMTGYARAAVNNGLYQVVVEMRSVNGKHLDLFIRLPKERLDLEEVVRETLRKRLRRGRVDCYVAIEPLASSLRAARIHEQTARAYWHTLYHLHLKLPGSEPPKLEHLLKLPGVWETDSTVPEAEEVRHLVAEATEQALDRLMEARSVEGKALSRDLLQSLQELQQDRLVVEERSQVVASELREKLRAKVQDILAALQGSVDENRLLQELAYQLDRTAINEELVRLKSHLDQMVGWIAAEEAVEGRRLDFMAQELLREVNTIGSKTSDLKVTQAVVRMKNAIGKIKEQIQNIE
ncbi:MAG: YicC/YloC family endoribonuclease [Desulfosoma sp.]|uniref:YicC/YloC family endoribonuclease n=1 Tax=Desulfosoma sp. TaxID=2603217 RepID=UPI00404A9810